MAPEFRLAPTQALAEVHTAVGRWREMALGLGVDDQEIALLEHALHRPREQCPLAAHRDRPLQQPRVLDDRSDQVVVADALAEQPQLGHERLARAQELARTDPRPLYQTSDCRLAQPVRW